MAKNRKTIAGLEADLYRRGVPFVHYVKDTDTADEAFCAFLADFDSDELPLDHSRLRFVPCTILAANCEHVPVVIFEDWDSLHPVGRQEALTVAASMNGHQALIIKTG